MAEASPEIAGRAPPLVGRSTSKWLVPESRDAAGPTRALQRCGASLSNDRADLRFAFHLMRAKPGNHHVARFFGFSSLLDRGLGALPHPIALWLVPGRVAYRRDSIARDRPAPQGAIRARIQFIGMNMDTRLW